ERHRDLIRRGREPRIGFGNARDELIVSTRGQSGSEDDGEPERHASRDIAKKGHASLLLLRARLRGVAENTERAAGAEEAPADTGNATRERTERARVVSECVARRRAASNERRERGALSGRKERTAARQEPVRSLRRASDRHGERRGAPTEPRDREPDDGAEAQERALAAIDEQRGHEGGREVHQPHTGCSRMFVLRIRWLGNDRQSASSDGEWCVGP